MLRAFSMAAILFAVFAVSAQAQIVSNPVLTTRAPYASGSAYAAPTPVAPSPCCAPPVVSYGNACNGARGDNELVRTSAGRAAFDQLLCSPSSLLCSPEAYYAPTTAYYAPAATSYAQPTVTYRVPATTAYRTSGAYMTPPTTSYSSPAVPTTSYYAPAATQTPVYSVPSTAGSSCGCRGG